MSKILLKQYKIGCEEYIAINIAIGANRPPRSYKQLVENFKQHSQLCKLMKCQGVHFDIFPVGVDYFEIPDIDAIVPSVDLSLKREEDENTDFNNAVDILSNLKISLNGEDENTAFDAAMDILS